VINVTEQTPERSLYDEYAEKIWRNEPYARADHIRWHTSGYHIREKSLDIDTAIEDAYGCLDILPEECGIEIDIDQWQEEWMEKPEMIAAMAKLIYGRLKHHGRYGFDSEPNWLSHAKRFVEEFTGKRSV
jgi:hypothetical protein